MTRLLKMRRRVLHQGANSNVALQQRHILDLQNYQTTISHSKAKKAEASCFNYVGLGRNARSDSMLHFDSYPLCIDNRSTRFLNTFQSSDPIFPYMSKELAATPDKKTGTADAADMARSALPSIWEYTDYRQWLTHAFQARKAIHSWYSYGVLAQRAGFKARDFLLRVMRGERRLSPEGAAKLASALDLSRKEQDYFLALVGYNQAKTDREREMAWGRLQHALAKSQNASLPRLLTDVHREILGQWHHLAIRSMLEMGPDRGDWDELGKRLRPPRSAAVVKRSVKLLQQGGLVECGTDGLWHATTKAIATPAEVGSPAVRNFHRECLDLARASLEAVPAEHRNITGLTLGISERTYRLVCDRITELREEISRLADADSNADRVYQVTMAVFPLSHPRAPESSSKEPD